MKPGLIYVWRVEELESYSIFNHFVVSWRVLEERESLDTCDAVQAAHAEAKGWSEDLDRLDGETRTLQW